MKSEKSGIKCFWLRDHRRNPITLVAYVLCDSNTVKYATATLSPGDQFNRNEAHAKARGRLNSQNESKSLKVSPETNLMPEIIKNIIQTEKGDSLVPSERRIYQAAVTTLQTFNK